MGQCGRLIWSIISGSVPDLPILSTLPNTLEIDLLQVHTGRSLFLPRDQPYRLKRPDYGMLGVQTTTLDHVIEPQNCRDAPPSSRWS
jgi:hypothetical protein